MYPRINVTPQRSSSTKTTAKKNGKITKKTHIDCFEAANLRKFAKFCMFFPRVFEIFCNEMCPRINVTPQRSSSTKTVAEKNADIVKNSNTDGFEQANLRKFA